MDPAEDLDISIPGEVATAKASSIWDDQEQLALAVALAAEFERWAAHNAVDETGQGKPGEYWAEQGSPTRREPWIETPAREAIDLSASVPTPDFASR